MLLPPPAPFAPTGLMRMSHRCLHAARSRDSAGRGVGRRSHGKCGGSVTVGSTCRSSSFSSWIFAKGPFARTPSCQWSRPGEGVCQGNASDGRGRSHTCHSNLTKSSYVISPCPLPHTLTNVWMRPWNRRGSWFQDDMHARANGWAQELWVHCRQQGAAVIPL